MSKAPDPNAAFLGTSKALSADKTHGETRSQVSLHPLTQYVYRDHELLVLGNPVFDAETSRPFHEEFINRFVENKMDCVKHLTGQFGIALRNRRNSSLWIINDRFATIPVFYARHDGMFVFAESASLLPEYLRSEAQISSQAIYNFLYFHMIPSPGSIYRNVSKMQPAHILAVQGDKAQSTGYWQPDFREVDAETLEGQSQQLHTALERAVADANRTGGETGCFLSGGLDSSSVAGYLAKASDSTARAFTIGFEAKDYDETDFARAAAEHFSVELNVFRMTPSDLIPAIREIAAAYDEPFGNSSALPTLFCARFAKSNNVDTLLAGDGGDELFAGNARYAKQKIFELYYRVPGFLRNTLFDRIGAEQSVFGRVPGLKKLNSYVRQALIPLPDRLETYNYLHHYPLERVFSRSFLDGVNTEEPLQLQRERYNEPKDASALNRMLYLDWKFTLADNDIRKVTRMCQAAGIRVEFPMLDSRLVDFSTAISSTRKLRGTYLRYFYRKSMQGFLPPAVLEKRKHGFGLPFGVWLVQDDELRTFAYDALSRLEERNYFQPEFVREVKAATEKEHAAYYGTMIWVMMMLEIWLSENH